MNFKPNNSKSGFVKAACLGLALLATTPALANVTRVSELVDVDPNVWAYKALKELVEKYDVLEGYPDKTFKGNKPATRYEMAQALYEVLKVVDLASAEPGDVETIGKLSKEFDKELAAIRSRLASLEGRVSALEAGNGSPVGTNWTDRIKISGDLTNIIQTDFAAGSGNNTGTWGTRARLGVDAILIADDNTPGSHIGEGIAHMRLSGGNGGSGQYGFHTSGNNLNDVLFDGSNPSVNNSLFSGRYQDSRMNAYIDQAYYTQVFKFAKSNPCSNEVQDYPNIFAVVDLGQQDLWNTFHKSLVREDSLDGFINQRVLHGAVGGSDATSEAIHIGLNFLGDDNEQERVDECGNVKNRGVGSCGQPLPGLFQALSLDYAFAAIKANGGGFLGSALSGTTLGNNTTNRVWDNHSHNFAANLLFDLPGEFFGTGLLSGGASYSIINYNNYLAAGTLGNDEPGLSLFAKYEQWLGKNRTFGFFLDYTYAFNNSANYLVQGPINQLIQAGLILNTTFLPETWNFNKDQLGLAYSIIDPFNAASTANGTSVISSVPTGSQGFLPALYIDHRPEQIIEAYYRKYLTENISVTPDLQLILNGNGHNTGLSAIIRATFKLPNWNDGGAFDQFGYRDWSQRIAKYKAAHFNGVEQ
ncbi:MAG: iron uptake porin [Candidatus Caenarcaniphilales bacterium]|nr:iron uptake porin [Candidatus Caenarcaniphilales bacterium]